MKHFILPFLFLSINSFGQYFKYRWQYEICYGTQLNYGRTFEDVSKDALDVYWPVYKTELYKVKHEPFSVSNSVNFTFAFNWINTDKWMLRQSHGIFFERYAQKTTIELTDIGTGDTMWNENFTINDVGIGYQTIIEHRGLASGTHSNLVLFRKVGGGWSLGLGVHHSFKRIIDRPSNHHQNEYYVPRHGFRTNGTYWTNQLGISFRVEKGFDRFTWSLKLDQAAITLKKAENKGSNYFNDGYNIAATSTNLDFKFPLFIRTGVAINFGRIKKD